VLAYVISWRVTPYFPIVSEIRSDSGFGGGILAAQPQERGTPYLVGNGVNPLIPLRQPQPRYTKEARKARAERIVTIQAIVRKDGKVDSFKIIKGLGYGLDESAINTIRTKWRFIPVTLNGVPVNVQANIKVSFWLYNNEERAKMNSAPRELEFAAHPLVNSDIVALVKAGLSADVILAKTNSSECAFDTSPDGLKQLKAAHVPDQLTIEMVKRSSSH